MYYSSGITHDDRLDCCDVIGAHNGGILCGCYDITMSKVTEMQNGKVEQPVTCLQQNNNRSLRIVKKLLRIEKKLKVCIVASQRTLHNQNDQPLSLGRCLLSEPHSAYPESSLSKI